MLWKRKTGVSDRDSDNGENFLNDNIESEV